MILFFDLDGPILDVSEKYYRAYVDSMQNLGCTFLAKNDYWNLKRSKVPDAEILKKTSVEGLVEKYQRLRNDRIETDPYLALDNVWKDLYKTYDILFRMHSAVLVTLRTYPEKLQEELRNLDIERWFTRVLVCRGRYLSKWQMKAAAILESKMLDSENVRDCIFVGDTETDILAGKELGMTTIGVTFGIRTRDIIEQAGPDMIFDYPNDFSWYLSREFLHHHRTVL